MFNEWVRSCLAGLLLLAMAGCTGEAAEDAPHFVTREGQGPDKWASAWLISRFGPDDAELSVIGAAEIPPDSATPFDIPGSELARTESRASFEVIADAFSVEDPAVKKLAAIIHEIEVNFWNPQLPPAAEAVESAYRRLQRRYYNAPRQQMAGCFIRFFDHVRQSIAEGTSVSAGLEDVCEGIGASEAGLLADSTVPNEVSIPRLLDEMHDGAEVAFVDVREPEEYDEAHIPGAINIPIRHFDKASLDELRSADYVVSYCIKDFRGFEMARHIKRAGFERSVILKPYGLKGWVASGLPLSGRNAMGTEAARRALAECVSAGGCSDEAI